MSFSTLSFWCFSWLAMSAWLKIHKSHSKLQLSLEKEADLG